MSKEKKRRLSKSRAKKGSKSFLLLAFAAVVIFIFGFYFYLHLSPSIHSSFRDNGSEDEGVQHNSVNTIAAKEDGVAGRSPDSITIQQQHQSPQSLSSSGEEHDTDLRTSLLLDTDTASGETEIAPVRQYQYLLDELNQFYGHLDEQPYMKDFKLKEPSRDHFSKLIQKVVDNPPVVTRETDDLFTLLKNTAHFFRILGKDNILILKGILDREKESFEDVLQTFYNLTLHPEYLEDEYGITLPFDALYDYAGFFLNTMGGRLYLFRRDSTSRMAVSYYAILVVDRAGREGSEDHGIDLRPAIDFLIDEMETGGGRLRLRDEYLDTLYDLKEKYN